MMRWCAYCQRFNGEAPPYDSYLISHGICLTCKKNGLDLTAEQMARAVDLRDLHEKLRSAGQNNDLPVARNLIEDAVGAGLRPADILLGLITPLLYELGQKWEAGKVTVADEHRFTHFFEQVTAFISTLMPVKLSDAYNNAKPSALLLNAKGNRHTLGLLLVKLSLGSYGIGSEIVYESLLPHQVLEKIESVRPKLIGISIALPDHVRWLNDVANAVMTMEESRRPILVAGGFAVHEGKVPAIKGVRLFTEFASIEDLVSQCINVSN